MSSNKLLARLLRSLSLTVLVLVLSFQFSIGAAIAGGEQAGQAASAVARNHTTQTVPYLGQLEDEMAEVENALEASQNGEGAPKAKDLFYATRQFHRVYNTDGTVAREIPLDRVVSDNPPVNMIDPSRELEITYNAQSKELEIRRFMTSSSTGRVLTDGHVIKDVEITTDQGNHVVQDGNAVFFSTAEGIRSMLAVDLKQYVFSAFIPAFLLVQAPKFGTIKRIDLITPGHEPRQYRNGTTAIFEGDLSVAIVSGGNAQNHLITREELVARLGKWKTAQLALLQIANPDLQAADALQKALTDNIEPIKQFISNRDSLLESGEGSDLLNAALRNQARNTDFLAQAGLISRNAQGQTVFDQLASSPRHAWSTNVSPEAEWARDYQTIQAARAADEAAQQPVKSWREYLVNAYKNPDADTKQKLEQAATDQPEIVQSRVQRLVAKVREHATPGRMTALAAVIAFDGANLATDGAVVQWAMALATRYLSWAMQAPGLGDLLSRFSTLPDYLQEPFALSRLAVATATVLALRPLSMIALQKYAQLKGYNWSAKKAFFTYGLRMYARVIYPFQKFIWEKIFRQTNLYPALRNGLSASNPAAWRLPFSASGSSRLDQAVNDEATRKGRAIVLAAAIVSERARAEGHPVDPATLMQLINAPTDQAVETMAAAMEDSTTDLSWFDLTSQVSKALEKLSDHGTGAVDEATMNEYHEIFSRISRQLKRSDEAVARGGASKKAVELSRFVRGRWLEFKRMTSQKIVPFILYGLPQLKLYETYKNAEVDDATAEIAEHQYREDYDFSAYFYAGADAATFGAMPTGNVRANAEILANQTEQVFIYGVQLGYDILTTGQINPLANPYAPLSDDLYADRRAREQTFSEASRAIFENAIDPDGSVSLLGTHRQFMINTLTGFQVRLAVGVVCRAVALGVIGVASGAISVGTFVTVLSSIPLQATALLAKISFGSDGPYATIWPYVSGNMRVIKNKVSAAEETLKLSQGLIESGLRIGDANRVRAGVGQLQALYQLGGTELPEALRVLPAQYTPELAQQLLDHSLANVPAPTRISPAMTKTLNVVVGALVSTIMYVSLSKTLFNPDADAIGLMTNSVKWFAINVAGLTAAQPVIKTGLRWARGLWDRLRGNGDSSGECEDAFKRK